jgi:NitT/TauT family transport system substrate-binding protein
MKRRLAALALAVLAVGVSAFAVEAGAGPRANASVSYRLDWLVGGAHACYYRALDAGYFAKQGLDVKISEGNGSGSTATLVANGSNDFGFADAGVTARTVNDGASLKVVAGIYQRTPSVIISLKEKGISKPADLKGKTVGAATGEAPLQLLPAYLKANGVDPNSVRVVNMDPGSKIPSLLRKRVDAIVGYATDDLPVAETQAPGKLSVQHYADKGVTTLSNGVITSDKMIKEQPDTVRRFVKAVQQGFADCQRNPKAAVDGLVKRFGKKVDAAQAQIALREVLKSLHTKRSTGKPVGWMSPGDWKQTLTTLSKYAEFKGAKPASTYYTDAFTK